MKIINEIKKITKKSLQKTMILILIIQCLFAINIEFNVYAQGTYELIATAPGKDPAPRRPKKTNKKTTGVKAGNSGVVGSRERSGQLGELGAFSGGMTYQGPVQQYIDVGKDVPLIMQHNVFLPWSIGTIAYYGCVPACIAMVVSSYSGEFMPVEEIATRYSRYADMGEYGGGTTFKNAKIIIEDLGYNAKQVGASEAKEAMQNGFLVIAATSRSNNIMPTVAHAIVITEWREDDTITINDPESEARSRQEWHISDLNATEYMVIY